MSLLEMSLAGGCIILAAALIRVFWKNRLPIGTFTALWGLACVRLVLPVRLPFRFSAWSLLEKAAPAAAVVSQAALPAVETVPAGPSVDIMPVIQGATAAASAAAGLSPWTAVWLLGACALALLLAVGYARSYRRFRAAEVVDSDYVNHWLLEHPLYRRVSVRVSDRVDAPLTYGLFRPVILLPRSTMDLEDSETLGYVLAHELAHIRRFDTARKLALAAAVCLHWFNPLAWLMAVLAGRDMERACDRAVLDAFGPEARHGYALALLTLEERRGGFAGLASGFSKNAIEERIHSIMKIREKSFLSGLLALVLVLSVGAAFATAAAPETEPDVADTAPTVFSGDVMASSDGTVYVFTAEGKPVSMTQQEYKVFTDPVKVEWWTAEEYAQWLEQEKKDLQACLGQRAWTNSDGWFTWTQEKIDETIERYEQILEQIKDGLLVSKTVNGRSDVSLMQGNGDVRDYQFSSEEGIVMYKYDDTSPSDAIRGYTYVFNDGEKTTQLGPCDTPEELLDALEEELAARVADGRLTQKQAEDILGAYVSASDDGWTVRMMTGDEADALQEQNEAVAAERQELEEQLARLEEEQAEIEQRLATIQEAEAELQDEQALVEERMAGWDETLAPYAPFGVTYEYDGETDDVQLFWNGERIRGIYDATAGVWITGHSGNGTWPEGTPEIIAVYTDGKLTGLREATESEQAEWDQFRAEAGITGPVSALPPEDKAAEDSARASSPDESPTDSSQPVREADGTETVPAVTVFISGDGGPYGQRLESGGRVTVADDVYASSGNLVAFGITTRTDATLTVGLRCGEYDINQRVELQAGKTKTVSFYPEKKGAYELYLANPGAYGVDLSVSWCLA